MGLLLPGEFRGQLYHHVTSRVFQRHGHSTESAHGCAVRARGRGIGKRAPAALVGAAGDPVATERLRVRDAQLERRTRC